MKNVLQLCLLSLLPLAMSCGEGVTQGSGTVTIIPASTAITTATFTTNTQNVTVNVLDQSGLPTQGIDVECQNPWNNRLPFVGASATMNFINAEDESVISIAAPDGSSDPGTVLTGETDSNGNFTFRLQYPVGGSYTAKIICLSARSIATYELTVSNE